jgi:hypothetical protein
VEKSDCGYVERIEESRDAYKILVGKLEGESLLGRPKCRWKGVKTDLKEIG